MACTKGNSEKDTNNKVKFIIEGGDMMSIGKSVLRTKRKTIPKDWHEKQVAYMIRNPKTGRSGYFFSYKEALEAKKLVEEREGITLPKPRKVRKRFVIWKGKRI